MAAHPYYKIFIAFSLAIFLFNCQLANNNSTVLPPVANMQKIRAKATLAKQFCTPNNYDTTLCLLVDMSLHSGLNRLYVWNFKLDTFIKSMPVGHGSGNKPWGHAYSKTNPSFSNEDGSHCTSLGKYKIGERAYSNWGIHVKYVLHGLDSTNSNAYKRVVVFHSWEKMPDSTIYPKGAPEGWGCPIISNKNMLWVDSLFKTTTHPKLLWVFN